EVIVLPGEEWCIADNLPVFTVDLLEGESGTFECVKPPVTADGAGDGEVAAGANLHLCLRWLWAVVMEPGNMQHLALLFAGDSKASLEGFGGEWELSQGTRSVEAQHQIVSKVCRRDERGVFEQQSHLRLQQACDLVGIVGMQRRRNSLLDRGQADHYDRLRL